MTKEELAAKLKGNQYGDEISPELEREAKESGLVVVFGASDDLMEFRGAIHDERGFTACLTADGLFDDGECDSECRYFRAAKKNTVEIEAVWGKGEYTWEFKTPIPHATFEIFEDEDKFCRGIVFALADVRPGATAGGEKPVPKLSVRSVGQSSFLVHEGCGTVNILSLKCDGCNEQMPERECLRLTQQRA